MRRSAITVGLSLTFGTGLVATTIRPAAAGYNVGVKYRPPRQRSGVLPAGRQCLAAPVEEAP